MEKIIQELRSERSKQDKKWGEQNHDQFVWLAILMEEIGEASKELFESLSNPSTALINYRKEMIQVGAVVIAAIESFDRNENMSYSGK